MSKVRSFTGEVSPHRNEVLTVAVFDSDVPPYRTGTGAVEAV